jgi:SAM-dependent methyltransferase
MAEPPDKFDSIRGFYDNEYYAELRESASLPWHCRKIGARLGNLDGKAVLDVACGTGEWLEFFQSRGASISGVELSVKAAEVCRRRFPRADIRCGPAETLPFDKGSFDLITCMGSLEHFLDKPKALSEMRRVARPGAEFVILVPNAGFLTRRLGLYKGTQQSRAQEEVLELDDWERLFCVAKLRVVERWRDLHTLNWSWIARGNPLLWPFRAAQAMALALWPIAWQYQVYHRCRVMGE